MWPPPGSCIPASSARISPDSEHLIAHGRSNEEIRQLLGVDTLDYLTVEELATITKDYSRGVCDACFTGRYTVPVPIQKSGE